MTQQKIIPHIWFDKEASQAASFYTSIFPNSQITKQDIIKNTPSGDCDIITFKVCNFEMIAISAGPDFKTNPSISFIIGCESKEEVNKYWEKLAEQGTVLMPLDAYPFSEHYGWIQDKYGVSWQLIYNKEDNEPEEKEKPKLVPSLLFVNQNYGRAEEAINYYLSTFKIAKLGSLIHYEENQEPNKKGTVMFADFKLETTWFAAMDAAMNHKFNFNEAISFVINCETQEEIDYYTNQLSHNKEKEQCGWVQDKYGVSWQITPTKLHELLKQGTEKQKEKVTQALLQMKRINITALEEAFNN